MKCKYGNEQRREQQDAIRYYLKSYLENNSVPIIYKTLFLLADKKQSIKEKAALRGMRIPKVLSFI